MLLLFGIALVISAIGFYRLVYFISIGYAFSIVAMTLVSPLRHLENLSWILVLQNIFLMFWELRLGIYLIRRDFQDSYRKEKVNIYQSAPNTSPFVKIIIWISVSLLYVAMFSSSLFNLLAPLENLELGFYFVQVFGLLLMGGGLLFEGISDRQKSNFKAQFPKRFCDTGLYRWVRCPNYLGEIMFWAGSWAIGINAYDTPFKWIVSLIGVVCIVLIMLGSTKRLEESQNDRYGEHPEYQKYIHNVPVLFPWIPVYSFKRLRVYLG